jgi:chromosomal replication initiator protein
VTHSLHAQWEPSKEALRDILSPEDAESWLGGLRLAQLSPERAVLDGVPNAFFHKRIARHFAPLLRDSLRQAFPEQSLPLEFELQLRVRDTETPLEPNDSANPLGPVCTPGFDRFHAGEENRIPSSLARQIAQEPGSRYNPFILVGASGFGKSHLLGAIADGIAARHPAWRVVAESAETFTTTVLDGMRQKRMTAVRAHYRGADALLLDDLAFIGMSVKGAGGIALHLRGPACGRQADGLRGGAPALGAGGLERRPPFAA